MEIVPKFGEFASGSTGRILEPSANNGERPPKTILILYPRDAVSELVLRRISKILSALNRTVTAVRDREMSKERQVWECPFPTKPGILHHTTFQVRLALLLVRNRRTFRDVWFLTGGTAMPIPVMIARMTGKVVFLVLTGSASKIESAKKNPNPLSSKLLAVSERITTAFASRVIAYGKSAIVDMGLDGWREDFFTSGAEFVDTDEFPYQGPASSSSMDIGFVGRLSPEKGLANLIESLRNLIQEYPGLQLFVVGVGPERERLVELTRKLEIAESVRFVGWIDHPKLAAFYGRLRFLVIPSSTEGLPNAMLEAMASGAIVLATRVGAIPDVIRSQVNGFLIDRNSPKSLEEAMRAIFQMDAATLEQIAANAHLTVLESYSFNAAVERYRLLLP